MSNLPTDSYPHLLPPTYDIPRQNITERLMSRAPNASQMPSLNHHPNGTPRPCVNLLFAQPEYGLQTFQSIAHPATISTATPHHTFTFNAQDGIPATQRGRYSHYIAKNSFDPAIGLPQCTPLLPIHNNHPHDLQTIVPAPSQAPTIHHAPTSKAGGLHHKQAPSPPIKKSSNKGKHRRLDSDIEEPSEVLTDSEDERPIVATAGHGGRHAGAGNYKDVDLTELLNLTKKELPVGQRGWQKIHKAYEVWAKAHGRPICDARSLELKFKLLAKQTKPTGAGKRPVAVTQAKAINQLINKRVATRSLNDSEIKGEVEPEDLDNIKIKVEDSSQIHIATIRSNKSESVLPRRITRATQSAELMQKLTSALDLDVQRV